MDEITSKQYARQEDRDKFQHLFNKYGRSTGSREAVIFLSHLFITEGRALLSVLHV